MRACVLVVEFSIRWKVNRAEKIEQEKNGEREKETLTVATMVVVAIRAKTV